VLVCFFPLLLALFLALFRAFPTVLVTVFLPAFMCFFSSTTGFFLVLTPPFFEGFSVRRPGFRWPRRPGDRHREG
jgi:hypothetical protein